ncbi:glycine/betaine ABC transporter substrate-binding protein [Boudabousia tangfeifanii]|uniref:Glycine/betaine ABC transporter substrate-binding protein n=1 Tax=Boudabousia tangfeifanii TaxID=1912795 RepID=A0A1D9MJV3_9ACTO|nr:ABC transporter permease/substrate-binding protein [Boudabousia tangfeifanii]AOZ72566.1 glycine/betaine ABC transporter substrate-binding protein [Boudabousia tangfeifanii]
MTNNSLSFYGRLLVDHVAISLLSAALATIIGVAIGIALLGHKRLAQVVIGIVNILYTIPSIALLGALISLSGIGNTTAIIALIIYGLLPIVRSTYVGLSTVDPALLEAGAGMGATKQQVFFKIQLPLALPTILAAIRTMVTMTIALAGIASFVGAGGLGVAIYRGITTNNKSMILIGSLLVALLALAIDALLGWVQHGLTGTRAKQRRTWQILAAVLAISGLVAGGAWAYSMHDNNRTIRLATKPVTEGLVLGQITAQYLRANTDFKVEVTDGVGGGTANIQQGMMHGDFDLYPEYTGTAWQVVLKNTEPYQENKFKQLNDELSAQKAQQFVTMFGFNDTYGLAVSKETANKFHLSTFSDLAKVSGQLSFGAEYDFFEREDGYRALTDFYQMHFAKRVDMDNGLKYQALLDHKIDVITVFTTDGQLSNPDIQLLADDRHFYPSYRAGLLATNQLLADFPSLAVSLSRLQNSLDEATMAHLNYQVEVEHQPVAKVARDWLSERGLLTSTPVTPETTNEGGK